MKKRQRKKETPLQEKRRLERVYGWSKADLEKSLEKVKRKHGA
jgi:hypothetical protein